MASIYQRARSVIVYLGEYKSYNQLHKETGTDYVQRAKVRAMERFLQESAREEEEKRRRLERGELPKPEDDTHLRERDKRRALQNAIDAAEHNAKLNEMAMDYFLRNILHEQYWSRGWIIQEIIMAPENLMVSHGSDMITWSDFMQWVNRYHQLYPSDDTVRPIMRLNELRELRSRTGSVLTLASLLETFKDSFTSYHHNGVYHDKIYSLLGLAHDSPDGTFPIDYKKTAAQLYKDCINHFWNNSSMTLKQRSIELPYFSALVRRILIRKPALRDIPDEKVRYNLYSTRYELIWQDEPNRLSRGRGTGLWFLKLYGFFSADLDQIYIAKYIAKAERRKAKKTWSWQASQMEDLSMWASTEHISSKIDDLHLRGIIVDHIEHLGQPYDGIASWSSEIPEPPGKHATSQRKRAFARYVSFKPASTASNDDKFESATVRQDSNSARNFVGASGVNGLAPSGARRGDLICRFWNTNTLALVRKPVGSFSSKRIHEAELELVGRVVMHGMSSVPDQEISSRLNAEIFGTVNEKAVNVHVALNELTHLTIDTMFWE
ncbi:hypothetical protein N0V90_005307 [Kalmusia sp. IMI 367209]|nr:hypothetical protein N0V90_005307 [Kalmusia sp. IMI 367209]